MNDPLSIAVGQHQQILAELGQREPTTALQANAVLESIRAGKGYLDRQTLLDLETIRTGSRERVLSIIAEKRRTEAAYTTRLGAREDYKVQIH